MGYKKLLILAPDAVNWKVLRPLMDAGAMPNLKALAEGGCAGVLESTLPPLTPAAWTTFMTGVPPGVHGVIGFQRYDARLDTYQLRNRLQENRPTLYHLLSDAGKRVGVAMQPGLYPPFELNGFVITGFDSPGTAARFTSPPELAREILELCPEHEKNYNIKADWEHDTGEDDAVFERIITRARRSIRRIADLYVKLLKRHELDVFMAYFQAPDVLFHLAWRWCDPATADESPARRKQIAAFFSELDQAFGRLLECWPQEERLVLVVSDHGQQAARAKVRINNILLELGFLKKAGPLGHLRHRMQRIKDRRQGRRRRSLGLPVDWEKTQAFMPFGQIAGFIYINLEGRQPHGSVPVSRYGEVRDRLIAALRAYRNSESGASLFKAVLSGDECFARKDEHLLPDVVVLPANGLEFKRKFLPGKTREQRERNFMGCHHPDGIYVFHGPGVKNIPGERAQIADMAPTLLAAMGLPVPRYMEGRPQAAPFEHGLDVRSAEASWGGAGDTAPAYNADEEAQVEARLRDLGYVD